MESHPKYGGTCPITRCCKEFNVPNWIGYCIADLKIRNRKSKTYDQAIEWLYNVNLNNISNQDFIDFTQSIDEISSYMRKYQ